MEPMEKGSTVGQIQTPMCKENVGKKNDPKVHSYGDTMNLNSAGGGRGSMTTSSNIMGPGEKGSYPKKGAPK